MAESVCRPQISYSIPQVPKQSLHLKSCVFSEQSSSHIGTDNEQLSVPSRHFSACVLKVQEEIEGVGAAYDQKVLINRQCINI